MKVTWYLIVLLFTTGCHSFREPPHVTPEETSIMLRVDTTAFPLHLASRSSVKEFYAGRDNQLFWTSNARLSPTADSLMTFIQDTPAYGLLPNDYHLDKLEVLVVDSLSPDRFVKMDVLLTDAFLTIASHLRHGRLDPKTFQRLDLARSIDHGSVASLLKVHNGSLKKRLQEAEPQFGQYHALKKILGATGKPGPLTGRDTAIALNLERWRWQKKLPDRYVSVNIPAFSLRVYERDSLWLETNVIVGKRETPTPVMESVIRSFIIYPYWHVPKSISTKEILPALQNDASYLRRNNFDVLNRNGSVILADTIQWDYYSPDNFPFVLRQREGSENSMGIIKFNFANNYGVYLHDTNSKRLFERQKRDLSHGCVRVKNAVAFAHYLVREDDIYVSPEDLDQYLSLQQRLKIDLRKPIPLKLEYFTAEVKDGAPMFYEDIYKKDSVMMQSLYPAAQTGKFIATLP